MTNITAPWANHPKQTACDAAAHIRALRSGGDGSVAKLHLQWIILSACRFNEAKLITHDEIDLLGKVWTLPSQRTKANRDYQMGATNV